MPTKKRITTAERRHQDFLRRKVLRVASVYERRLILDRRKELRRVLGMATDYDDPLALVPLLTGQLDETSYLGQWWVGLITDAGLPIAKATASDLRAMKAAGEEDIWLGALRNYATARAGSEIVVVTGTWKKTLVGLVRQILAEDLSAGVEKVTKELYKRYLATLERWQCRRIISISAKLQNLLDQFMDRQILFFPQLTIHPVKVIKCALRGFLHGMHCSFRKRTLRIFHTNLCHLFLIQSHQGRPKNRRHRNILIGIIQNPQHCQHRLYFRCRKISGRRLHICRYPRSLQNLHKIRSVVF